MFAKDRQITHTERGANIRKLVREVEVSDDSAVFGGSLRKKARRRQEAAGTKASPRRK
jgi:hypothetical protein